MERSMKQPDVSKIVIHKALYQNTNKIKYHHIQTNITAYTLSGDIHMQLSQFFHKRHTPISRIRLGTDSTMR
jgi:hypothetical protein